MPPQPQQQLLFRIGHGYDLHRLEPVAPKGEGRAFILGGVHIEHDRGPVGHSDGDVLLHAVTDAILGALGLPDIGQLFPDSDPSLDNADSSRFIARARAEMEAAGYAIANLDATVICERPKLSDHKDAVKQNLAKLLGCGRASINIKGKTHERVDAVGEGLAIEVHAVVLLQQRDGEDSSGAGPAA